ncbi:polymorphic toxin type 46 domain-containing protein [Pseudomonas sp. 43NM1]|uniref:polymorphic toxin type 46 domain-containing protein n=1 Tax=Pseudomonas sp. 43NM1 TaxID=1904755 RepID=UPI0021146E02|nr:polymorphic toxin type 46 domain-containing protein [Pseudomonas sp. 43NM1]
MRINPSHFLSCRTGNINNDINARGRKETATEFYRTQGFEETNIPGHLSGIDFNQPVNVETLNRGKTVYQFQSPGAPQGNYYSLNPATSPSMLGIGPLEDNRATCTVELKLQGIYRRPEKRQY